MDELPEHFKTLKNKLALPLHSLCIRHHKTKSVNPFLIEPRLELDILTDLGEQMRFLKTWGVSTWEHEAFDPFPRNVKWYSSSCYRILDPCPASFSCLSRSQLDSVTLTSKWVFRIATSNMNSKEASMEFIFEDHSQNVVHGNPVRV